MKLYEQLAPAAFFCDRLGKLGLRPRARIYSAALVIWLMMFEQLSRQGSLSRAVAQVVEQRLPAGMGVSCKRLREGRVSSNTGGYSQARTALPVTVVNDTLEHFIDQLRPLLEEPSAGLAVPVCVLDGSSAQMTASAELLQHYPPPRNQHGHAHYPVLRLVVAHDLATGLALPPAWGPMYGPGAVSEQQLADDVIRRLPPGAVVIGDRNFGVFSIAYAAQAHHHGVLLRLTEPRATHLAGARVSPGCDQPITWRPSRWDQRSHPGLPADAGVPGRIVACQVPGFRTLYLFTTLTLPPAQLAALYLLRWNIETDLRSLKQTVQLQPIAAKSVAMVEKNILVALCAYNLVRAVMTLAARQAGIGVRQLSFSRVRDLVEAFLPSLADDPRDAEQRFQQLLLHCASCRLPQRHKPRSFPRAVWGRGYRFPRRKR